MYIEDIIQAAVSHIKCLNSWEDSMMTSFSLQIYNGSALTEKQAKLAVKILTRNLSKLNSAFGFDITGYIEKSTFRLGIRTITVNNNKKISIIEDLYNQKVIKVEFPFDEKLLDKIRKQRIKLKFPMWKKEEKAWHFSLDADSLAFLTTFAEEENFSCDDEFTEYSRQVKKIQKEIQIYHPMLVKNENKFELINVSRYTPQITEDNLIDCLFQARKLGINVWDDAVEEELSASTVPSRVKEFLKLSATESLKLNMSNEDLTALKEIIPRLFPCLFILPGGSEKETTQLSVDFLKSIGVSNSEISVLFRMPNSTHADFNQYIRDNELNSPISEKTRAVLITGKIPKTILESKIYFHSLVNYSFHNVHYTIREYVTGHPNVIHLTRYN